MRAPLVDTASLERAARSCGVTKRDLRHALGRVQRALDGAVAIPVDGTGSRDRLTDATWLVRLDATTAWVGLSHTRWHELLATVGVDAVLAEACRMAYELAARGTGVEPTTTDSVVVRIHHENR